MEQFNIKFDDAELFDQILEQSRKDNLPDYGDLQIVTKANATESGKSLALISFSVHINGKRQRVQTVTTLRLLGGLVQACAARVEFEAGSNG